MESIQFIRSRHIPGHQLHDVTFQDSKGQPGSFRFLLCQWSDGTWYVIEHSGGLSNGTSPRSEPPASSDRPWLSLAGSTSVVQETAFPGGEEGMQEFWKIVDFLIASADREKAKTFQEVFQEKLRRAQEEGEIQELRKFLQEFQQTWPALHKTEEEQLAPFNHFLAHGEVTDNGFNIVRVRLISANGLVFEDTVQDSLVFFAGHRKVIRPLQAELYHHFNELVSCQTVLQPSSFPPDAHFDGLFRNRP